MDFQGVYCYALKLFSNKLLVMVSVIGATLYKFFFPEPQYLCSAAAVLGIMIIDLLTKAYALSHKAGGLKAAFLTRTINSKAFGKGTTDKLILFGIMIIICGLVYRLTVVPTIASWFTQIVFVLMFLRDLLSIFENLSDAGMEGLSLFKKAIRKKICEVVGTTEATEEDDSGDAAEPDAGSTDSDNTNTL